MIAWLIAAGGPRGQSDSDCSLPPQPFSGVTVKGIRMPIAYWPATLHRTTHLAGVMFRTLARSSRCSISLRGVAHGLDVVPVRITDERREVVRVVFGPEARLVKDRGTRRDGRVEEGADGLPVGSRKGDV